MRPLVSQKTAFGVHTLGVHWPFTHTSAAQSVPPVTTPEPSALHVVATLPSQVGCDGVHALVSQVAPEAPSTQRSVVKQDAMGVDVAPSAEH
jgi:hypothetical protein